MKYFFSDPMSFASKFSSFLFTPNPRRSEYGFFALRMILGYLWLDTVIPRWFALAVGHPEANALVNNLFGSGAAIPITYLVTGLETIAAIFLLVGFLTRLAAVWGVIQFSITGVTGWTMPAGMNCTVLALPSICSHITGSFGLLKDFGLLGSSLVLFFSGSQILSVDKLIFKRKSRKASLV
jgi:uncharacterized membrane protein YphA (DoxX/SURF4 family)